MLVGVSDGPGLSPVAAPHPALVTEDSSMGVAEANMVAALLMLAFSVMCGDRIPNAG